MSLASAKQFRGVFSRVIKTSAVVDPAVFVDNESQEVNVTVPGAKMGDFVLVGPGVDITESSVTAFVTAADTVTIVLAMTGGDTNNLASSTWNICVLGF